MTDTDSGCAPDGHHCTRCNRTHTHDGPIFITARDWRDALDSETDDDPHTHTQQTTGSA